MLARIQRQQALRQFGFVYVPATMVLRSASCPLNRHGHFISFALEFPLEAVRITVKQCDSKFATSINLVDYIGPGTETNRRPIKHQSLRPFVFAHRLVQQNQCLHHR
ncbi:MAG: hypothetical protein OXC26_02660 [Albidovulum sp.]|nr:hypothetical protein [Albidovulum sp.]